MNEKVPIVQLDTGVPGLNEVLGGGLPEFSFNLLAGGPGSGKTTLAHQICFALATPDRPALYITVLGEPPVKLLRYQQQFEFFDPTKIPTSLRFLSIGNDVLEGGLGAVLARIVAEVEETNPRVVIVDSFRSVARVSRDDEGESRASLQGFVQRLALHLTAWQATTFLVGEYQDTEKEDNPIFTVADGILWLYQNVERNAVIRKLRVVKMRGQATIPGLHTFHIASKGVKVFPRQSVSNHRRVEGPVRTHDKPPDRLSTGIRGLDELLQGGIPSGYSMLLAGPSGSGKTTVSMQFLLEGIQHGEPGLLAAFDKRPFEYFSTNPIGRRLAQHLEHGSLHIIDLHPLDLSLDETLEEVRQTVVSHGVKRIVIDSLSGLELALAPGFRDDFRETLHRMVGMLASMGITLMMTVDMIDSYIDLHFSPHGTAFLTDGIILQRYIELEGQLKRLMAVVKLRGSQHRKDLHLYEITEDGLVMGESLKGYEGLMTGSPKWLGELKPNNE